MEVHGWDVRKHLGKFELRKTFHGPTIEDMGPSGHAREFNEFGQMLIVADPDTFNIRMSMNGPCNMTQAGIQEIMDIIFKIQDGELD